MASKKKRSASFVMVPEIACRDELADVLLAPIVGSGVTKIHVSLASLSSGFRYSPSDVPSLTRFSMIHAAHTSSYKMLAAHSALCCMYVDATGRIASSVDTIDLISTLTLG
ncbi:hypothetical protein PENSPDRAFT_653236 [Peniophora sp. CONT]|nr:hypothetical protein PENSPDRAFT_653236 [Peniophora sp. CONT]